MRTKLGSALRILPRIRIVLGNQIAVGPGKAELLQLIRETSSISEAARRLGMSYMRAWSLIQTMNRSFREPVILARRGGQTRGGASLTATGERLLILYQRLEREFLAATKVTRHKLAALTRVTPKPRLRRGSGRSK
jgi:molybdate transport system regulatory protein